MKAYSKKMRTSSIVAIALVGVLSAPLAPAHAATSSWGFWSGIVDSEGDFEYPTNLTFTGSGLINADVTVDNFDGFALRDTLTRYYTSATPMGSVFGANGPCAIDVENYARHRHSDNSPMVMTVTFDSVVPAGQLGFALSNFDDDKVTVRAYDASNNPLSGTQIVGSAASKAFNYCDPAYSPLPEDCPQEPIPILVPTIQENSDSVVVTLATGEDDYIGTTAWFRPNVAVSKVTFTQEVFTEDIESDIDFWFAQTLVATPDTPPTLPATGANVEWLLGMGLLVAIAGSGFLAFSRRKRIS
jgi:LPXTG-motif cell wall-anchored protein